MLGRRGGTCREAWESGERLECPGSWGSEHLCPCCREDKLRED